MYKRKKLWLSVLLGLVTLAVSSCSTDEINERSNEEDSVLETEKEEYTGANKEEDVVESFDGTYTYIGQIDRYPIQMVFTVEGEQISGSYYYESVKSDLTFSGTIIDTIVELAVNESKESFNGEVVDGRFYGKWQKGDKVLDFELIDIEKDYLLHDIDINNLGVLRKEMTVVNFKGQELAIAYYDMPISKGNGNLDNLTTFFEYEMRDWLSSYGRYEMGGYSYNYYIDNLEEVRYEGAPYLDSTDRESIENDIAKQPAQYKLDSYFTNIDSSYVSILQVDTKQLVGGTTNRSYYGSTFSAETGKLLPMTDIVEIDDKFKEMFTEKVAETLVAQGYDGDIVKKAITKGFNNVYAKDQLTNWEYRYFYDGDNIYFIIYAYEFSNTNDLVIRWNMDNGTAMEVEPIWDVNTLDFIEVSNSKEDVIYGFDFNSEYNKTLYLAVDRDEEYIVFRVVSHNGVELEYPSDINDSWNNFSYYTYYRGGGAGNEGLDIKTLTFEDEDYRYKLDQVYSAVEENTTYSFSVMDKSTNVENVYNATKGTVKGNLGGLEGYEKLIIVE